MVVAEDFVIYCFLSQSWILSRIVESLADMEVIRLGETLLESVRVQLLPAALGPFTLPQKQGESPHGYANNGWLFMRYGPLR